MVKLFQFCLRILGSDLRGVGDVYHFGLNHMFIRMIIQGLLNQARSQFAVLGLHSQNLMACGLDGPCFMDIDMAGGSGYDRLIGTKSSGDGNQICLCTTYNQVDIRIWTADFIADQLGSMAGMDIQPIACILNQIGVHKCFQNPWVGTLAVVIGKTIHIAYSSIVVSIRFLDMIPYEKRNVTPNNLVDLGLIL